MSTIKKYIQMSILFMVMFAAVLEAAPLMSLAQPAIEPSPLDIAENNGEGVHNFSFDTLVRNIISGSDYDITKPLRITIPKNEALSLTFDDTMTLFKGSTVQNNLWSFDESDPFDYIIVFDGSALDNDRSRFALNGTLTVEAGETGKFFLEVTIKSSTGGDSNIENNSDRETLEKRLQ